VTPAPTATPTGTPTPTITPTSAPTLRPTSTRQPTPTSPPPFALEKRERRCINGRERPLIEVVVQTEEGAGLPGVEIWVTWNGGADRFITGLKPELGLGYADFEMKPELSYGVSVGDPSLKLDDGLRTENCVSAQGETALVSWRLVVVATGAAFTPTPIATQTPTATPTRSATRTPAFTPTTTPSPNPSPPAGIQ
jgi:hypothetical protein